MSNELKFLCPLAFAAAVGLAAVLASCASKPTSEETAGSPFRSTAVEVAGRVAKYSPMDRACFAAAVGIVEGGIVQKLARTAGDLRHGMLLSGVAEAEWYRRSCPPEALPGLAFGTADASHAIVLGAHTASSVD